MRAHSEYEEPGSFDAGTSLRIITPDQLPARIEQRESVFEELVMSPLLDKLGYSQEDVERVNNERRMAMAHTAAVRNRQPVFNIKATFQAEYAPPEFDEKWKWELGVKIGDRNRVGDECIKVDLRGTTDCPVVVSTFKCSKCAQAYESNPAIAGCTLCFMFYGSGGGGESNDDSHEAENLDPRVESRW